MAIALAGVSGRAVEPARWLVIIGIAWTLANTALFFFADQGGEVTAAGSATPSGSIARPEVNLNEIIRANLFGKAEAKPVEQEEEPTKETRLPLELNGVFVAAHPEDSAAIIAQKGKPGLLYGIGDRLPGNATLHRVHPQHVVLRRAGVLETLTFPETRATFTADPHHEESVEAAPQPTRAVNQTAQNDRAGATTPQQFVENYRDRLKADPDATLQELGIARVSSESAAGYRLDDLARNPYLKQTGLQSGDVILSVNGRPVGDVGQDQQQLDSLLAQGSARLEVQRGTRRFFVTASLK